MIKITIYHQAALICGFKVIGHAGAAQYGHDIVCAAVSALSITTINSILQFTDVRPKLDQDTVNGGWLILKLPQIENRIQSLKAQTLLDSFELGMKSIADQYARYVNLKIIKL